MYFAVARFVAPISTRAVSGENTLEGEMKIMNLKPVHATSFGEYHDRVKVDMHTTMAKLVCPHSNCEPSDFLSVC